MVAIIAKLELEGIDIYRRDLNIATEVTVVLHLIGIIIK